VQGANGSVKEMNRKTVAVACVFTSQLPHKYDCVIEFTMWKALQGICWASNSLNF